MKTGTIINGFCLIFSRNIILITAGSNRRNWLSCLKFCRHLSKPPLRTVLVAHIGIQEFVAVALVAPLIEVRSYWTGKPLFVGFNS